MTRNDLALYVDAQFVSPWAMSAFVAMQEKELDYALHTVDLDAGNTRQPPFSTQAVTQRVPLLIHDGLNLTESTAIAEYLEELFPARPVYPVSLRERARARQVQSWLRSDLMPIREERSTEASVFRRRPMPPLSPSAQAASKKLTEALAQWFEDGRPYLCGEQWCLADTDLAVMINRLVFAGDPMPSRFADYAARIWQRPSSAAWVSKPRFE